MEMYVPSGAELGGGPAYDDELGTCYEGSGDVDVVVYVLGEVVDVLAGYACEFDLPDESACSVYVSLCAADVPEDVYAAEEPEWGESWAGPDASW